MIEKLKELEQEAMDELTPEEYEAISEDVMDDYQRPIYMTGYIDGLQTAIRLSSENDSSMSYTVEMEDIFIITECFDFTICGNNPFVKYTEDSKIKLNSIFKFSVATHVLRPTFWFEFSFTKISF